MRQNPCLENRIKHLEERLETIELNDDLTSQSLSRLWDKVHSASPSDNTSEKRIDDILDMVEVLANSPHIDRVTLKSVRTSYLNEAISEDADIIVVDRVISEDADITHLIETFPKSSQVLKNLLQ